MGYDMSALSKLPGEEEALLAMKDQIDAAVRHRNEVGQRVPRERQTTDGWTAPADDADPEWAAAQREVVRLMDIESELNRSYFRLNIWGMAQYRSVMEAVGMGFWSDDFPEWPKPEAYGIESEKAWAYDSPEDYPGVTLTDAEKEAAQAFKEANDAVRKAHPGERPGIPLEKFCSNDGWHVIPAECRSALQLFGEFIARGADKPVTWEQALAYFRAGDELQRRAAAQRALMAEHIPANTPVGHDGETTILDVLTEEYWLKWLRYLEDSATVGGFEVY